MVSASGLNALLVVALAIPFEAAAAQDGIVYVNDDAAGANDGTSWADAFTSLQSALAAAQTGDQVWVAEGTYKPSDVSDPSATFALQDGVGLYGGFAGTENSLAERAGLFEQTVLTGQLGLTSSEHVVSAAGTGPSAVLDGFLITLGVVADVDHETIVGGAGLWISAASPSVVNCTFDGNRAGFYLANGTSAAGGGVLVAGGGPRFTSCTFRANVAQGGWTSGAYDGGSGLGGALANFGGAPMLFGCRFIENRAVGGQAIKTGFPGDGLGGAVYSEDGTITFAHCVLAGNSALGGEDWSDAEGLGSGGGLHCVGAATLAHCTFSGNVAAAVNTPRAHSTGGALSADGDVIVSHCTFSQNFADNADGVVSPGGTLRIANSILWNNGPSEATQVYAVTGVVLGVSYSCIQGLTGSLGGTGNTGLNPSFQDANGADDIVGTLDDDLRLEPGSPCIDAADNLAVPADDFDLDGDGNVAEAAPLDLDLAPRFSDDPATADTGSGVKPLVDMGGYEFQGDFCQWNLGFQGPGSVALSICGDDLTLAGSSATVLITGAQPNKHVFLLVGLVFNPTPVHSGTVVPVPPLVVFAANSGSGTLAFPIPGAGGPAVTVYVQAATKNGTVIQITNAVEVVIGT